MFDGLPAAARATLRRFPMLANQFRTSTGMVHRKGGVFRLPPGFGRTLSPLAQGKTQAALRAGAATRLAAEMHDSSARFWTCIGCGFANAKAEGLVCARCARDAEMDLPPPARARPGRSR